MVMSLLNQGIHKEKMYIQLRFKLRASKMCAQGRGCPQSKFTQDPRVLSSIISGNKTIKFQLYSIYVKNKNKCRFYICCNPCLCTPIGQSHFILDCKQSLSSPKFGEKLARRLKHASGKRRSREP